MVTNHQKYGEGFWQRFNTLVLDQLWWYTSVLQLGKRRLPDCPLNHELEQLVSFCVLVVGDMAAQRQNASESIAYAIS